MRGAVATRTVLALGALLCLVPQVKAQKKLRRIQVQVTGVSGNSVFLDKGRTAGLTSGIEVVLTPAGQARMSVTVRAVSSSSSRAELQPGFKLPPVGTVGEALVPETLQKKSATPGPKNRKGVPDHPPWERVLGKAKDGTPLLAPAFGLSPKERPMKLRGRVYGHAYNMWDKGGPRDNQFGFFRLGASLDISNPFSMGGEFAFDGDFDYRGVDLWDGPSETNSNGRIDRFSYSLGNDRLEPYRGEVGRFISREIPEFGLLDGAEVYTRVSEALKVGAGFGFFPEPMPHRNTGDDISSSVFVVYNPDAMRANLLRAAVQKTWHKGKSDRDMLFLSGSVYPTEEIRLYTSTKIDYYSSTDTIKSSGFQVTEAWLQAQYQSKSGSGGSVSISHWRWPELLRSEYRSVPATLIRDGHVNRFDVSGWFDASDRVRFSGRVNLWSDQSTDGKAVSLTTDIENFLDQEIFASFTGLFNDGAWSTGPGFRMRLSKYYGETRASFSYRFNRYRIRGLDVGSESHNRHSLLFDVDFFPGDRSMVSFNLEHAFGESEDSYIVGIFFQQSF